jgi:putative ABC transport system substrate-binding protein
MRRREFIGLLLGGSAAAWPLAGHAQQRSMPVVGFLSALSQPQTSHLVAAFRRGLAESGIVEGQGAVIEYRFAEGRYDRLPALAGELVRHPADLILAAAPPAALAAKAVTTTIPIVFVVGFDPVAAGLVASLNRPGGNATGITLITTALAQKRLEILLELVPKAGTIAMLVNPGSPDSIPEIGAVQAMAQQRGLQIQMLNASTPGELATALAGLEQKRPHALVVASDPFYVIRREELAERVAKLSLPAIYPFREFPASGGLISYGTNIANAYRQAGVYAARILKGAKTADLPVMQPTTFELVINLKAANALGITVPVTLQASADEVIE